MIDFLNFLKKCSTIDSEELSFKVYNTTEFEFLVVSLITEGQPTSQLANAIGSDGFPMGFYSLFTEIESGGRKKEGDPYTLIDSGFYANSHELKTFLGGFQIVANSTKDGKDFLQELDIKQEEAQNLTDENLQIVINEHKELFSQEFRKLIDSFKGI